LLGLEDDQHWALERPDGRKGFVKGERVAVVAGLWVSTGAGSTVVAAGIGVSTGEGMGGGGACRGDEAEAIPSHILLKHGFFIPVGFFDFASPSWRIFFLQQTKWVGIYNKKAYGWESQTPGGTWGGLCSYPFYLQ
jgi:hypothetical protein